MNTFLKPRPVLLNADPDDDVYQDIFNVCDDVSLPNDADRKEVSDLEITARALYDNDEIEEAQLASEECKKKKESINKRKKQYEDVLKCEQCTGSAMKAAEGRMEYSSASLWKQIFEHCQHRLQSYRTDQKQLLDQILQQQQQENNDEGEFNEEEDSASEEESGDEIMNGLAEKLHSSERGRKKKVRKLSNAHNIRSGTGTNAQRSSRIILSEFSAKMNKP